MIYRYIISALLIFGIVTAQAQEIKKPDGNRKQSDPDVCYIQGKIIKIIPARKKISKQTCKQAPCHAIVEIIEVETTGRTFPVKFGKGEKIQVKFTCSLKAGNELPGLKKKDMFKANIKAKPKKNSNTYEYLINTYLKL